MKCRFVLGIWALPAMLRAQDKSPDSIANTILETRFTTGPVSFFTGSALYAADGVAYSVSAVTAPIARQGSYSWRKTGPDTGTLEFRQDGSSSALLDSYTFTSASAGTFQRGGTPGVFTVRPFRLAANAPLANVSCRVTLAPGQLSLTGFVVAGLAPRRVLIRAIGPALAAFGVANAAARPVLTIFKGSTPVAANSGWGGTTDLSAAFSSVGAFALPPTSADCALAVALEPGAYTAQVRDAAGGEILVEIYFIN